MRIEKITERDYEILKHLSYGPSNILSIGKKFFLRRDASKEFSKYTWRRLLQLQNAGLIQCKKVDRHDSPIVVLQKAGAYEVALRYGLEIENIRCVFPKTIELMHDLMVASTMRKMVEEAEIHNLYKIEYIHTEYFTRKVFGRQIKKKGEKKNVYFPDFRIRIVPYQGEAYTFDVEIDAASMGRSMVFDKISSFRNNVLLVVPNGERLRRIFQYLQNDMGRKQAILPPVSFVLWSHFISNGCRFSEVIQFPSGDRGVLPISMK
ncbi:MAG: hypothetical protein HQL08_00615 [Nitrospirae bacterium]|nr:hypothetical protein [Nitrospirota bacterium]